MLMDGDDLGKWWERQEQPSARAQSSSEQEAAGTTVRWCPRPALDVKNP
ncbi:hypothetical protein [Streptomyces sp. TE5632]